MAVLNHASKELQVKIVYYGPALCGKTTNLQQVYAQTTAQKGKLVSLATSSDRTLFFDFLPVQAMAIRGYQVKFQLYTVPGQVIYNTTRKLVLRGVDGLVFVADSQYQKMAENLDSFNNLKENLASLNLRLEDIPYVVQYNKRDLPNAAPMDLLEYMLNNNGGVSAPSCVANASQCEGVFETLNLVTRLLLQKFIVQANQSSPYVHSPASH